MRQHAITPAQTFGKRMTFVEAAAEVLRLAGKPLHYKEITDIAVEKGLLSHVGKSPEVTMGARLAALLKKDDPDTSLVRVRPGVFGLKSYDTKPAAAEAPAPADLNTDDDDDGNAVNALDLEAAVRAVDAPSARAADSTPASDDGDDDDDDDKPILAPDDALRADLAAGAAEVFDDEDDDDQPILGGAGAGAAEGGDAGRRRRRRRRRGRGGKDGDTGPAPSATAPANAPLEGFGPGRNDGDNDSRDSRDSRDTPSLAPRPMVRERHQIMGGGAPTGIDIPAGDGEDLAGRELADAVSIVLAATDRSGSPTTARHVAEALARRGRLSGDPMMSTIQVQSAVRADNARRLSRGERPRFRLGIGGRLGLVEWSLPGDVIRLEQEMLSAVERYRDAMRRAIQRRVSELPGPAFVELALLSLERSGMADIRTVKRTGTNGGELHFSGLHQSGGDAVRCAIVIRKDGREIGRERVIDLRGSLHHYGDAVAGWLLTSGQVLSGAREEATASGACPVALYDGASMAKLLEETDVAVQRASINVAYPDFELFEALKGV